MNAKFTLLLSISFLLQSCADGSGLMRLFGDDKEVLSLEKDFNKVKIENDYALMLPKYMKEDKELHPDASLAYQHALKEVATLVLDENKLDLISGFELLEGYSDSASFIENYVNVQINLMSENLGYAEAGTPIIKVIDEVPAAQVWLEGRIDNMDLAYFITCIDGGEKVYLVLSYTSKEKKSKFEDTFQKIGDSFSLLRPIVD